MSGVLNVVQNRFRDPLTTKTLSIANDFTQLKKIQASDAQQDYRFGVSVAVSDTRIVVGSLGSASAYIFDINGNFIAKLEPSPGSVYIGYFVAVSNTRIVVSNDASGDVHIFDINGNFIAKIQGYNSPDYIKFGASVAVSDTRIVVGAIQDDNEVGSAYIFDINGNELAKIQAFDPPGTSDAVQYSYFGTKVAVSDNRIVVGAFGYPLQEGGYPDNTGAAFVFDIDGNELAKIRSSDLQGGDYFGVSVAVSDTRIVVGAMLEDTTAVDAGSAYIFDIDGNQLAKIQAFDPPGTSDAEQYDNFGESVAVSDTRIVVGARRENNLAGSAYIFDINGNQLAKIQASDAQAGDWFGQSVAVSDTRIVVGALYEDTTATDAGSVYIYKNFHNDYDSIPWEKIRLKYTGDVE